jgi:hypothetical protein
MPELSRRRFLTGTSLGVAGIAASAAIPAMSPLGATGGAGRSAGSQTGAAAESDLDLSAIGGDVVAHVRDSSIGEVAILVGGTERIHHDPELVARLLRVARQAPTEA